MGSIRIGTIRFGAVLIGVNILCAATAGVPGDTQKQDGVTAQINLAHTGNVDFDAGFEPPLVKLWSQNIHGTASSPLVAENKVFVVSNGVDVYAFDSMSGDKIWKTSAVGGTGAYDQGNVFYYRFDGQLTSLKAKSGHQNWSVRAESYTSTTPIAFDGRVFVVGQGLTATNEKTGAVLWSKGIDATDGTAAYGDGGLYVGGPCQYYKFAPSDGALLWHDAGNCEGGGGTAPVYFKKNAYLVDWAEGNFVLNADSGAAVGSFAGAVPPTFFVRDNNSYALELTNEKLYCINLRTGNVAWSLADGDLIGQPVVINGHPMIGTNSGKIYLLDGATGKVLWSDNVGDTVSSLNAGEGVLVVTSGSKITAYAPQ